jgi:hypothetical protein
MLAVYGGGQRVYRARASHPKIMPVEKIWTVAYWDMSLNPAQRLIVIVRLIENDYFKFYAHSY